eukprot:3382765-Rhodomonas_salina.1
MLKAAPREYLTAIFNLMNAFLTGADIPHEMKGAMAILLLKKELRDDLRNHRLVCLMHVATKMTTAIITDRMVRNIEDNH